MPDDLDSFLAKHPEYRRRFGLISSVGAESERGMTVLVGAELDQALDVILTAYIASGKFRDDLFMGGSPPLGSFSAKINLARALQLIKEHEYVDLHAIRRIRNEFAHVPDATFSNSKIANWASQLRGEDPPPFGLDEVLGPKKALGPKEAFERRALELIAAFEEDAVEQASQRQAEERDNCTWYRRG